MSQIKVSGNLTKDPNFFRNENSADAVMFTLAENVDKDSQYAKTYYHTVKVRGAKAKTVAGLLEKGALVRVEGRLESYTKDGVNQTTKDGEPTDYAVVFWNITAFVIDMYDRQASEWKSVIASEPKSDTKSTKSAKPTKPAKADEDDEEDEVPAKPQAASSARTAKAAAKPVVDDDDDDF
jgi:single-stranded DNA-binding protein